MCMFVATITPIGLFFTEKINLAIHTLRIVAWRIKTLFSWVIKTDWVRKGFELPVQQELGARQPVSLLPIGPCAPRA